MKRRILKKILSRSMKSRRSIITKANAKRCKCKRKDVWYDLSGLKEKYWWMLGLKIGDQIYVNFPAYTLTTITQIKPQYRYYRNNRFIWSIESECDKINYIIEYSPINGDHNNINIPYSKKHLQAEKLYGSRAT